MFFELQLPICDARGFSSEPQLRRDLPDWPNPVTSIRPQFVHYYGRAVERRLGADQAWPDETKFCTANRAIRFPKLEQGLKGISGRRLSLRPSFRRLFCDGGVVVRVEVGLSTSRRGTPTTNLSFKEFIGYCAAFLRLPTVVPQCGRPQVQSELLMQGRPLARLYAQATAATKAAQNLIAAERLVEEGNPLLIVEFRPGELDVKERLEGFTEVDPAAVFGQRLLFGRLRTPKGTVGTWLLQNDSRSASKLRSLRICLKRLHAEQEALDLVLKQIKRERILNPPSDEMVDRVDEYLNRSTRLINRTNWGNIRQSAILEAFDAAERVQPPDDLLNLTQRYQGARNQIWKKVDEYQIRRAARRTVQEVSIVIKEGGSLMTDKRVITNGNNYGNIITAEYMQNVTNTVNNNLAKSTESEDAKALVKQLSAQVNDVAGKADAAQASQVEKLGDNLERLSEEVARPKPKQEWYELSLKGLKEAAEAIGAIAEPVIATVTKLTTLLVGA